MPPLHLSFHDSEQRWLHPLHGLGEVRGAFFMAITTKPSGVRYPLVGEGCWPASFRVGQNAGAAEQSAPALHDKGGKRSKTLIFLLLGKLTDNRKQGHRPPDSQ